MYGRKLPWYLLGTMLAAGSVLAEPKNPEAAARPSVYAVPAAPAEQPTDPKPPAAATRPVTVTVRPLPKPVPGKAPPPEVRLPSVVLSTDELIKRYHLDVRTAIAVHELLRAQEAKQTSALGAPEVARRLNALQEVQTETDTKLGTLLQGTQLLEVRERVRGRFQAHTLREARAAGLVTETTAPRDPAERSEQGKAASP